ncbi:carboxypeptidase M32 [Candidatus Amesbacteria bacterium]|nr:carboxypeptidase M32 [Candidatus Amesbacteria bacterium]
MKISNELCDLAAMQGLLSWDQETQMPVKGAEVRAYQLATMAGIYHDKLISESVGQLISKAKPKNVYDRSLIREMKREYEKATKIPKKLVEGISEAVSRAFDKWRTSKKENDFKSFAPYLEKVLELEVKAAELMRKPRQSIYDVMLDNHEADLTEHEVERVFGGIKNKLTRLTSNLTNVTRGADEKLNKMKFDEKKVKEFAKRIISEMGYDWEAGRQDESMHPFEISLGVEDVRITTWKEGKSIQELVMVAMHETGHALYEQGVNPDLERTHLAGGQGLVLHESQSRLWENMVGRSEEFWQERKLPVEMDRQKFVKAVNVVKPSLVRVEADEVTYGLHIMIRFEIEKELVAGKIKVRYLPEVWNKKYHELLGITPENDREGVLQDVHWAHGSFGYFPTYLLGTMTSAQIWNAAQKGIDVYDLKKLRGWLREKIHRHGKVYTSKELVRMVTGEDLNPKYFLEYLENKFEKVYNVFPATFQESIRPPGRWPSLENL